MAVIRETTELVKTVCPCDGNPVYSSITLNPLNRALADQVCENCYWTRCDAYPGACRGEEQR